MPELSSAAMDALSEGRQADDPSIRLSGTASRAMHDAIAEILTVAGYDVLKDANDMTPFQLKVLERHPRDSWRDWLHAQTARRQEVLMTTARKREAHGRAACECDGCEVEDRDGSGAPEA
ncbi:hypothetical protein [Actinoallomurus sp. NPDC050550]|uniref:hypothetical protein n=1 Tax=Actinoallomurus sp. NPDC050550 TaxID=3154937 RepID=UPI0033C0AFD0